ncbi:DUF58 domain-containing protein [bacterium]|nr:DUF58 domain-containing protein [candidate division CSSED10-310 bacterium]
MNRSKHVIPPKAAATIESSRRRDQAATTATGATIQVQDVTRWCAPLLMAVLALLLRSGFFAFLLYTIAGLWGISRIMARMTCRRVTVTREKTGGEVAIGETVRFRVRIENHDTLPILWIWTRDWFPDHLAHEGRYSSLITVPAGGAATFAYQLSFRQRGFYRIGPVTTVSGDMFGLARRTQLWHCYDHITVLPRIHDLTGSLPLHHRPLGELRVQKCIHEDPTRPAGVREYQRSDGLRRIHWKASARLGALRSKVYESSMTAGAMLILDLHHPSYRRQSPYSRSEMVIQAAASLLHLILGRGQKAGFLSNAADAARVDAEPRPTDISSGTIRELFKKARSSPDRHPVNPVKSPVAGGQEALLTHLRLLARLELATHLPGWRLLLDEYPAMHRDTAVVILAPQCDRELAMVIEEMRRSGFSITLLLFEPDDGDAADSLPVTVAGDVPVHRIKNMKDLDRVAVRTF